MGLSVASGLLVCPVCQSRLDLFDAQSVLLSTRDARPPQAARCLSGHSYDVARAGYLNLSRGPAPPNADTAAMVTARNRFLESHHYDPFVERGVARAVGDVILEAGAGPAFYLAACVDADPQRIGLAIDISVPAARVAAKAHPRIASIVADIWRGLPVADGCVTTVLSVFAPRNLPEFSRILAPGGRLMVLLPNPGHLASLRQYFDLMRIHPDKVSRLVERMPEELELEETSQYSMTVQGTVEHVRDVIAMGPNAFHGHSDDFDGPSSIDIDVSMLLWRKRGPEPESPEAGPEESGSPESGS